MTISGSFGAAWRKRQSQPQKCRSSASCSATVRKTGGLRCRVCTWRAQSGPSQWKVRSMLMLTFFRVEGARFLRSVRLPPADDEQQGGDTDKHQHCRVVHQAPPFTRPGREAAPTPP